MTLEAGSSVNARTARRSGLLVPLFASPSSASWGIGEIGDLTALTAWLAGAGVRVLQLLPVNEMAPGQQSPYSAISAMAIDPIFISLRLVPEFADAGGEGALGADERGLLEEARRAERIQVRDGQALEGARLPPGIHPVSRDRVVP